MDGTNQIGRTVVQPKPSSRSAVENSQSLSRYSLWRREVESIRQDDRGVTVNSLDTANGYGSLNLPATKRINNITAR
jgi:hypothetical protein